MVLPAERISINNYKVSVLFDYFPFNFLKSCPSNLKRYNNFYVFKSCFTFIIFPTKNFVNITGLKCKKEIPTAIDAFKKSFSLENTQEIFIRIDNITATFHIPNLPPLRLLFQKLKKSASVLSVRFNPHLFPSVYLKLGKVGTFVIFASGKTNLVGCRSTYQVITQAQRAYACIKTQC